MRVSPHPTGNVLLVMILFALTFLGIVLADTGHEVLGIGLLLMLLGVAGYLLRSGDGLGDDGP